MTSKEQRAREIQETIRDVLVHDWDPVGVGGVPEAQDEYDSYVGAFTDSWYQGPGPRKSRSTSPGSSKSGWGSRPRRRL